MDKFWDIRASSKEADVDIFGTIGDLGFWEESITAANFVKELRGIGRVNRLNVNIYSGGGSVWDAMAMYRALRDFPAEKVVHVAALAGSAAVLPMLAGDRIEVAPEAEVMIHNPWGVAMGGEKDMQDAAARLKACKDNILNVYEKRTGGDRDHLSDLMDAETWFRGDEIKEAGFADVVKVDTPKVRVAACIGDDVMRGWRNKPNRKPKPLAPEVAARVEKLRAFNA